MVVIGAVSLEAAIHACCLVKVEVQESSPVLTIDDAISTKQFIGPVRHMQSPYVEDQSKEEGDTKFEATFRSAPHQLEGRFHSGGQEQFYFETQAALAEAR